MTAVLEAVVGRVALAWVHRDRPTEVHLARGALSPLTVAVDTDQNLYWASNPRWFRDAERHTRVEFASVVMLREGTYVKIGMERRPGRRDSPEVLATANFLPTARDTDMDPRVWTGFTAADQDRDRLRPAPPRRPARKRNRRPRPRRVLGRALGARRGAPRVHTVRCARPRSRCSSSAPRRRRGRWPGTCRCAAGCGPACGTARCRRSRWRAAPSRRPRRPRRR